jgi:hypothetical protein
MRFVVHSYLRRGPGPPGHTGGVGCAPSKTPSGQEVTGHLRRLVRRIRRHWPTTTITLRGDSHYGRPLSGRGYTKS